MNVRLLIEYDGTDFAGWQKQPHKETIQGAIEAVLKKITRKKISIYGAGRTDSGVHALGQVCNFTTDDPRPVDEWRRILNFHLPYSIRILESAYVPEKFHSQKSATVKTYEYRIVNGPVASALHRNTTLHFPRPVDWDLVRIAAKDLIGTHDFRSFQGARATVKSTTRTIYSLEIIDKGLGLYGIRVCSNGFLKQMVRAIAGTLLAVGERKIDAHSMPEILSKCDRRAAGPTAPACGLFLIKVLYPEWVPR